MGAWEAGNFDNDNAMDWIGDLCESGSASTVRTALMQVIAQSAPHSPSFMDRLFGRRPEVQYLDVPTASEALAAAEIVACWHGKPLPNLPEGVAEWVSEHSCDNTSEFIDLARKAVAIIKTKSELKDLWEEGDAKTASEWYAVITDLEGRLQN